MQYPIIVTCTYILHISVTTLVTCLSPENIQELLISHNFYRRLLASSHAPYTIRNMNELVWNSSLAYAAAMSVSCLSLYSQNGLDNTYSSNAGRRRTSTNVLTEIIRRWYRQRHNYIAGETACLPHDSCNQFRNMVNARHHSFGCAATTSCGRNSNIVVLLCLYGGGEPERFQIEYGSSCSGCTHPNSFCRFNLCVPCDTSREQCDCKKTCRKEGVGYGVLDQRTCTCNCTYGNGPNCDAPCVNPETFENDDVCEILSPDDCDDVDMGQYYREFCPAVCSCRPLPSNATMES